MEQRGEREEQKGHGVEGEARIATTGFQRPVGFLAVVFSRRAPTHGRGLLPSSGLVKGWTAHLAVERARRCNSVAPAAACRRAGADALRNASIAMLDELSNVGEGGDS